MTGPDCIRVDNCFSKITDEEKVIILESFYSIEVKEKQDTFLYALISINSIIRRRPKIGISEESRTCTC